MGVASLARAGLAWQHSGERAGFVVGCVGGGAGCETFQSGLNGGEVIEGVEAVRAAAEFAGGLRATQHEKTQDSGLVPSKIKDSTDAVLVLGDAGVTDRSDEGEVFEGVQGLAYLFFCEIKHGVAAGALITRVDQRIQRERIVFGRGDLFFDEGAEDAELDGVEAHI